HALPAGSEPTRNPTALSLRTSTAAEHCWSRPRADPTAWLRSVPGYVARDSFARFVHSSSWPPDLSLKLLNCNVPPPSIRHCCAIPPEATHATRYRSITLVRMDCGKTGKAGDRWETSSNDQYMTT